MISGTEFENSLKSPVQFWGNLSKANVNRLLGQEVAQMIKYNQNNPHHCYDLFLHTLHTVENLGDGASDALLIAAFFHDIGKPFSYTEKDNVRHFYNHPYVSSEISKIILTRIRFNNEYTSTSCIY